MQGTGDNDDNQEASNHDHAVSAENDHKHHLAVHNNYRRAHNYFNDSSPDHDDSPRTDNDDNGGTDDNDSKADHYDFNISTGDDFDYGPIDVYDKLYVYDPRTGHLHNYVDHNSLDGAHETSSPARKDRP